MPVDPITATTVLAACSLLGRDLYSRAKASAASLAEGLSAKTIAKRLSERVKDISSVKTLLCLETPQLVTDFYSPQFVRSAEGDRFEVPDSAALNSTVRRLIVGVAGQGKSILLRYLSLGDIARHELPVLVELRNYEHALTLESLLLQELQALGLPGTPSALTFLTSNAPTHIYLDAFDEVPQQLQLKLRKEIEDLCRRFPNTPVTVSSRPSLCIEGSPYFPIFRLSEFSDTEAIAALRKMAAIDDEPEAIVASLARGHSELVQLLTTPLMVALLLLHYRITGKFPETELAFYNDLFDVLLRRHDQTKGYKRTRLSNASEMELRELFCYLSYSFRRAERLDAPRTDFQSESENAKQFFGRDYSPDGALTDVVSGTNLLLEDGSTYRFAHKSIQEFYTAQFLVTQPEGNLGTFLRNRLESWSNWAQVLAFIELASPYLFCKHFLLPHVGMAAFDDADKQVPEDWNPSHAAYSRIFGKDVVIVRESGPISYYSVHLSTFYPLKPADEVAFTVMGALHQIDWNNVPADAELPNEPDFIRRADDERVFELDALLSIVDVGDTVRDALKDPLLNVVKPVLSRQKFVAHRNSVEDLFA